MIGSVLFISLQPLRPRLNILRRINNKVLCKIRDLPGRFRFEVATKVGSGEIFCGGHQLWWVRSVPHGEDVAREGREGGDSELWVNMRKSDNEELIRKSKLDSIGDLMLPKEASHLRALIGLAVFRLSRLHMIPDFFLKDFISKLYAENRSEKLELLKGLTLGRDETVNISPLQQDVLLVWGEHDSIFPLDMAIELKGLIGKNVKLESIKDASHVPQIERPNKFNYILNSFLCGSS
ncbi:hypothetical protein GH714_028988 [Hevea brasiliensis]|uniref:AB hydrolase-1 domain-containing protein n=1 Tax=Hevea brasiliensis TaxID=3981 RepID=A0A6A6LVU2_HEVBR|nr:hypothetical protein GH714_028988 [Hevea brasiliensis]